MPLRALPICPNDHPPFGLLCAGFKAALGELGYAVTTAFLGKVPLRSGQMEGASAVPQARRVAASDTFDAALTHRYTGYLAGLAAPSQRQVSLAHGFGMLRRWRRRAARSDRGLRQILRQRRCRCPCCGIGGSATRRRLGGRRRKCFNTSAAARRWPRRTRCPRWRARSLGR